MTGCKVTSAHVVLVVGPPLAGVTGVVAALRAQLPELIVVDGAGAGAGRAPDAVVAVVSAVAPLARTDWALVARAATRTDLVIGVVAKIDAHRGWRDVMAADLALVEGWDDRGAAMPWVGVAAAPGLGEHRLDDLVAVVRDRLAEPGLHHRDKLRASAFRRRPEPPRAPAGTERAATRLQLLRFARDRSAALRTELRDLASEVPVGGAATFETVVRVETARFLADLDDELTRVTGVAAVLPDPPELGGPSSARRLEGRLSAVLGVGFGLGIALAFSRLWAGLVPALTMVGLAAGAVAGLGLVAWVVRVRGLLHDRALLDRWVTEVVATVRWHGEAMVAERLLAVPPQGARSPSSRAEEGVPVGPEVGRGNVTDQYEW